MPIILSCPVCKTPFPRDPGRVLKWPHQNFCTRKCRVKAVHPKCYEPFDERFWARVNRDTCLGESCGCHRDLGHCWPWMANRSARGYGRVWADGKLVQAHRVASTLTTPLMRPPEIHSLHRCDNTCCCRPDHVFHGTHTDNMRDAEAKDRRNHQKGEHHGRAVLKTDDIRCIRALRGHFSQERIAHVFRVGQIRISTIQLKQQWKEVIGQMDLVDALAYFDAKTSDLFKYINVLYDAETGQPRL
jgi:hypothetical protein